jgi:hypothetical protein
MSCSMVQVVYHVDDEETPYLKKVAAAQGQSRVTLGDLKAVLNRPNYKYFFKSKDDDFGVVKEELTADKSPLPLFNGRVVCWLELGQGSVVDLHHGQDSEDDDDDNQNRTAVLPDDALTTASSSNDGISLPAGERGAGVGETRPPSFHGGILQDAGYGVDSEVTESSLNPDGIFDDGDTESSITSVSQAAARRQEVRMRMAGGRSSRPKRLPGPGIKAPPGGHVSGSASAVAAATAAAAAEGASSMMSSELESSIYDTEGDDVQSMASSR